MSQPVLLDAVAEDHAPGIARIYNHYIANTLSTFEEAPVTPADMAARIRGAQEGGYCWFVAVDGEQVLGYAYANILKPRTAYRYTAETSVYIDPDHLRKGLARALYDELIARLHAANVRQLMGIITVPNPASIALHEALGFVKVAHLPQVGFKFGQWVDVGYWQRDLGERPHAPACARNREPIAEVLAQHLRGDESLLEIGSGTGEHAVFFAQRFPDLQWQCSDLPERLPGIAAWLAETRLPPPVQLDAIGGPWPETQYDAVFTANSLHIMPWPAVQALFAGLPAVLAPGAQLIVYGPFKYNGEYTSASNADFDASLQARGQGHGIREFAEVNALAGQAGLTLVEDHAMPANNQCIVWRKAE